MNSIRDKIQSLLKIFGKNKEFGLDKTKDGSIASRDLQIAIAVLALEQSGRDGDYAPEEVDKIKQLFGSIFSLDEADATQILSAADEKRASKESITACVKLINALYSQDQRVLVVALLWQVLYADGKVEKSETRFIDQIKNRLLLSESDIWQAQRIAKSGVLLSKTPLED